MKKRRPLNIKTNFNKGCDFDFLRYYKSPVKALQAMGKKETGTLIFIPV
jgi:hypothetical protein